MRAVIQRVSKSFVTVNSEVVGEIDKGYLIFLGVGKEDSEEDAAFLVEKIIGLRIFEDSQGKMNLALPEINGSILVVSQFTLQGDCRKGRRPSFSGAASAEMAKTLYKKFVDLCKAKGVNTHMGRFQAHMEVELINDGPVTILLDSKKTF